MSWWKTEEKERLVLMNGKHAGYRRYQLGLDRLINVTEEGIR